MPVAVARTGPVEAISVFDVAHLRHPAVGGVVLFTRNFSCREQLERLIARIRDLRDPRLLVCIDQEGGRVQRLRDGYTRLPDAPGIGMELRAARETG